MPVDINGNRADVIKFAKSVIARLNCGQIYEQYIGAASRDLSTWVRNYSSSLSTAVVWNKLLEYYKVVSPSMYTGLVEIYTSDQDKVMHIDSVISDGIYLYIPPDNSNITTNIIKEIEKIIVPTYGPVTYRDLSGKTVITHDKVFIGVQQMIILEKTDQHPMAVSSGLLQHHGLLAGLNKISRQGHPSKVQAVKVFSETEVRMYDAFMGSKAMCTMMTMANSPEAHKTVITQLVQSETPSNLPPIKGINHKTSRPLMVVTHCLTAYGLQIKSKIENQSTTIH